MSDQSEETKLAVLENEVKNVVIQIQRLVSHIESEQRTRSEVNKALFDKFDHLREVMVTGHEFEDVKKKSSTSKTNISARSSGRWFFPAVVAWVSGKF